VQIADRPDGIYTTRVGMAEADLIMGCDPIVAAHSTTLTMMRPGRTKVALNTHETPTADLVHEPGWQFPAHQCEHALGEAVGRDHVGHLDAVELASKLLGDAIYANPLMLGYAWQRGWVPLSHSALTRAIELNAVQVELNRAAFEWGRRVAHDAAAVMRLVVPAQPIQMVRPSQEALASLIQRRYDFLIGYQDAAYAQTYQHLVHRVQAAERALGGTKLTEAVARNLFKLMAYKDEYEVARLLSDASFKQQIDRQFEGDYKLAFNLAPPWLASMDAGGAPAKRRFGQAWMPLLKLLPKFKALRGTWFDPFAYSHDRKLDRQLLKAYQAHIEQCLGGLNAGNLEQAVAIAKVPDMIKGYGHVRTASAKMAQQKWQQLHAAGAITT
jgi:indolepyruvate ferredoxin oxidoreductase